MSTSKLRIISETNKVVEFHGPADITDHSTEAIVNAANSSLMGGGGVDGAIHDRGGPSILKECKQYVSENGHLPAGQAMLTRGGRLTAKFVIHTVGPVYRGGEHQEPELLASCYRECIRIANKNSIHSIAFPAISTGAYGYPLHEAAAVAVVSVLDSLGKGTKLERVHFVLFDVAALKAYIKAAEKAVKGRTGYRIDKIVLPESPEAIV